MRISNRNAKAVAVLTAAAGLAASVQLASAQTWVNPNSGNWSVGGNWVGGVAPLPLPTTAIQFNATGTQSYTSNNDLANPFTIGSLSLNNSGSGSISLTGSAFTGGTATGGAYILVNGTGTGTAVMSNGGTLYSLRVAQGNAQINGGNWNLLST